MAKLDRLPNGYRQVVKNYKLKLSDLVSHMENLKDVGKYPQSLDTQLSSFAMHVRVDNKYYDDKGILHIAFDKGIIGAEALVDKKGKWKLSPTCTVFIDNTEDFVDCYKW